MPSVRHLSQQSTQDGRKTINAARGVVGLAFQLDHGIAKAAGVGFAVVLTTPDDLGKAKENTDLEFRARQNVIFDLTTTLSAIRPDAGRNCRFSCSAGDRLEPPSAKPPYRIK